MGWIADLLKEIPSAARYKAELEEMEQQNAELRSRNAALEAENASLSAQLQARTSRPATTSRLPADKEKLLVLVCEHERILTDELSGLSGMRRQVVEMHVEDLMADGYIDASYATMSPTAYYVLQKGRRYLHEYGLL